MAVVVDIVGYTALMAEDGTVRAAEP